jgi:hypothetical protein
MIVYWNNWKLFGVQVIVELIREIKEQAWINKLYYRLWFGIRSLRFEASNLKFRVVRCFKRGVSRIKNSFS